jgi:lipopolysaccharide export system protein LptA
MTSLRIAILLSLACSAYMPLAHAERADRTKPMEITAQSASYDAINSVQMLDGNIVIVQGTLRVTAAKGETRKDADGNFSGTVTGSPVTVRQKREGCELFVEAQAERVEFDQSKDTLKLLNRARIKSGDDELTGDQIHYNTVTEVYQVQGGRGKQPGDGLVRMVIQPKESGKDPCAKKNAQPTTQSGK